MPVHIWHGDADPFVPVAAARLVAQLPDARLTVFPGEGYSVDYHHTREILETMVGSASGHAR